MTLPLGLGDVDMTQWSRGLLGGFIQGGSTAVVTSFGASMLSKDFTVGTSKFFELVALVFVFNGMLSFFSFLSKEPLPPLKTVTASIQSTQVGSAPPVITTKVTETHTEPVATEINP